MSDINDRVAYLKGLAEGMKLSDETNEGKLLLKTLDVLEKMAEFPNVCVRGLMAIPPICAFPEENRPFFLRMKQLFVDNGRKKYDNVSMDFLSMGMSGDYTEAIACGANLVRVGTAIFGARDYSGK